MIYEEKTNIGVKPLGRMGVIPERIQEENAVFKEFIADCGVIGAVNNHGAVLKLRAAQIKYYEGNDKIYGTKRAVEMRKIYKSLNLACE